jgi:hypothetical protein
MNLGGEVLYLYFHNQRRKAFSYVLQGSSSQEVTCYAESEDGINWKKPRLGLFEVNGSSANNIVFADRKLPQHTIFQFCSITGKVFQLKKDLRRLEELQMEKNHTSAFTGLFLLMHSLDKIFERYISYFQ